MGGVPNRLSDFQGVKFSLQFRKSMTIYFPASWILSDHRCCLTYKKTVHVSVIKQRQRSNSTVFSRIRAMIVERINSLCDAENLPRGKTVTPRNVRIK